MFGKRGQNRSENGQPMGNLSQPQEKKAKLEGEDEAELGTGTSSYDVNDELTSFQMGCPMMSGLA